MKKYLLAINHENFKRIRMNDAYKSYNSSKVKNNVDYYDYCGLL